MIPKRSSTPASMPAASDFGTCFISVSTQPVTPHTVISAEATRNAPTASLIGRPTSAVASSAAPGVDQAVSTGLRKYRDSPMHVLPMPKPSASNHELMCAGPAPAAEAAWNTMAAELV